LFGSTAEEGIDVFEAEDDCVVGILDEVAVDVDEDEDEVEDDGGGSGDDEPTVLSAAVRPSSARLWLSSLRFRILLPIVLCVHRRKKKEQSLSLLNIGL